MLSVFGRLSPHGRSASPSPLVFRSLECVTRFNDSSRGADVLPARDAFFPGCGEEDGCVPAQPWGSAVGVPLAANISVVSGADGSRLQLPCDSSVGPQASGREFVRSIAAWSTWWNEGVVSVDAQLALVYSLLPEVMGVWASDML